MQQFPHHYQVTAQGAPEEAILISSQGLPDWPTAAPAEFDGPGDLWSPETMLVGAAANCFILTFRAIAKASKFAWTDLRCEAQGLLDRVERVTQFTEIQLHVKLQLPAGSDAEKAQRLLEKSEQNCLITSSMKAKVHLQTEVTVEA
ncbi:MAG: OsmC family protein [Caldilineaceae bacterium]|nr:OsmC family protein [Caldilineaceae bacterium]